MVILNNNINIGVLKKEDTALNTFYIVNKNSIIITIDTIITDCNCISVLNKVKFINPNDTGEVTISFDKNVKGIFRKIALVNYKENVAQSLLVFSGNVTE